MLQVSLLPSRVFTLVGGQNVVDIAGGANAGRGWVTIGETRTGSGFRHMSGNRSLRALS